MFHYGNQFLRLLPKTYYDFLTNLYLQRNFLGKKLSSLQGIKPLPYRLWRYIWRLLISIQNLPFEFGVRKSAISILSLEQTLHELTQGKSLTRFGDGELELLHNNNIPFQVSEPDLQKLLQQVLRSRQQNLLIALPPTFGKLSRFTFGEQVFWRIQMTRFRSFMEKNLQLARPYADAFVTRPYLRYRDKSACQEIFSNWRQLWQNKKVLIVEGATTRFGISNDLLEGSAEVCRIIAPSRNAFSHLTELRKLVVQAKPFDLVLIALGPSATILAWQLAKDGFQAIDIGHLDIEYEWFLKQAQYRTAIPGKDVLELGNKSNSSIIKTKVQKIYQQQIIAQVL